MDRYNMTKTSSEKTHGHISTADLTQAAMLAALALALSWVESIIPFQPGIPGVKLGLPNLVIVFCLYRMNARSALLVNSVRILLAGAMWSGAWGTLYSICGAAASFLVMAALLEVNRLLTLHGRSEWFSIIGISMAGGVFHNLGQLAVAMLAISNLNLIYYGVVLILTGMATGIVNGILARLLLKYIPRFR